MAPLDVETAWPAPCLNVATSAFAVNAPNGLTCCAGTRVHAVLAHLIFESNIDWDLGFHIAQLANVALYLVSPILCAGSDIKVYCPVRLSNGSSRGLLQVYVLPTFRTQIHIPELGIARGTKSRRMSNHNARILGGIYSILILRPYQRMAH